MFESATSLRGIPLTNGYTAYSEEKPFIHPLFSAYPELGCDCSRLSRVSQASFFPATLSSSSSGILKHSQARWDILIPPATFGYTTGSPSWMCLRGIPPREGAKPPQLAPFEYGRHFSAFLLEIMMLYNR